MNVDDVARDPLADGTTRLDEGLVVVGLLVIPGEAPPTPSAVLPGVVAGAGVTNPLGAGELNDGDAIDGDVTDGGAIDGAVRVGDVTAGDEIEGDVSDPPRLRNGCGAGSGRLGGPAGRGRHGVCSVCLVGLGFATV